jgi:hypothetical protein
MRKDLTSNGAASTDLVVAVVLLLLVLAILIVGLDLRRHIL